MNESFVIQSDTNNLPYVEDRVFHFCHECHVGNYYSTVSVAVLQAVSNAIVHGNASNSALSVSITLGTCTGGLFVEVADQGKGFHFENYGEIDSAEGGVGIFVMKSLSDRMTFSDGGRVVRMEFDVAGIDPADALERISCLRSRFALVQA
ncbi:MAG: ATP-binding protein [Bacteroidales bacterium]|nr:ATP-binding protein [Bacteroidales bacterium]